MILTVDEYKALGIEKGVITVGSFDGVHRGHRCILDMLKLKAKDIQGKSVVITFDPHPRQILKPDIPLFLIDNPKEKYQILLNYGIDFVVVVPFSRNFSLLTATEYIHDFLIKNFNPAAIVLGYDHQYGRDRNGDIRLMRQEVSDTIEIVEIDAKMIDEAAISSTKIRKAIVSGDFAFANEMLGRPYTFEGIVVHGKKLGRTIGYPTANISPSFPNQLLPPKGIYAVKVIHQHREYLGAMSVGVNPTVSDQRIVHYEVYILDFDQDIYGDSLAILVHHKIRDEMKFDGLAPLIQQITEDVNQVRAYFSKK